MKDVVKKIIFLEIFLAEILYFLLSVSCGNDYIEKFIILFGG